LEKKKKKKELLKFSTEELAESRKKKEKQTENRMMPGLAFDSSMVWKGEGVTKHVKRAEN